MNVLLKQNVKRKLETSTYFLDSRPQQKLSRLVVVLMEKWKKKSYASLQVNN